LVNESAAILIRRVADDVLNTPFTAEKVADAVEPVIAAIY
jgi:hypothetical protein